uniref:Uncharacterized protein n=1 Tax=Cucumis melo TaxID=3656 RepID=A0A9I9EGQ1_CUCME
MNEGYIKTLIQPPPLERSEHTWFKHNETWTGENPVLSSNIQSIRSGKFKHIDSPKQHVGGDPRVYSASLYGKVGGSEKFFRYRFIVTNNGSRHDVAGLRSKFGAQDIRKLLTDFKLITLGDR